MSNKNFEVRCNLIGWIIFILSALFFLLSSIKNGDLLAALGSFFFLLACFVFLIPYLKKSSKD